MQYNQTIKIADLIEFFRTQKKTLTYCVYGKGSSDEATLETDCVIGEYSEITDDDEEIFPESITRNNLEFWFTDELLEDVIFNALKQKASVTSEEILKAIKHYNEYDSFMDLWNKNLHGLNTSRRLENLSEWAGRWLEGGADALSSGLKNWSPQKMTSTKIVSIWVANTGWSIPTLQQVTTPSYSEDGEFLGSDFTRAFALDFIDDDLMEADKIETTSSLPDAIERFSYDSEISNSINKNPTKIPPTDTVILIYGLQYSGTPNKSLVKGKLFMYSGSFEYRE